MAERLSRGSRVGALVCDNGTCLAPAIVLSADDTYATVYVCIGGEQTDHRTVRAYVDTVDEPAATHFAPNWEALERDLKDVARPCDLKPDDRIETAIGTLIVIGDPWDDRCEDAPQYSRVVIDVVVPSPGGFRDPDRLPAETGAEDFQRLGSTPTLRYRLAFRPDADVLGWIASGTLRDNATEHLNNSDLFGDNGNPTTSAVDDIGIREGTNVEVPG
jgi:hypothetical protein